MSPVESQEAYPAHRWFVLTVACLAILTAYMNVVAYAPLISQIAFHLKIETGRAMHLISVTYIVTAVALIFAGFVCDRYGLKLSIRAGLLLSILPTVFVPFIKTFGPLMALRVVQGIAPAFVLVTVGAVTAMWFPRKEQGLASGLMMGSLSLGAAIGLVLGPALWKLTGTWQAAVSLLSTLGWLTLVLSLFIKTRTSVPVAPLQAMDGDVVSDFNRAIRLPVTWVGVAIFFFSAWGMHSLYALVPTYLSSPSPMGIGLQPVLSGKLSLALTLIGIVAVFAGGVFLDRVVKGNYRIVIAVGFGLTAVSSYLILLPIVYKDLFLLTVCLIVAGWGIPFTSSPVIAFVVGTYPPGIVARMLGLLGGLWTFGGAAGVYVGGVFVANTGSLYGGILFIGIAAVIAFALTRWLRLNNETITAIVNR
jgi:predicted MFS family arabinose efflux permease